MKDEKELKGVYEDDGMELFEKKNWGFKTVYSALNGALLYNGYVYFVVGFGYNGYDVIWY